MTMQSLNIFISHKHDDKELADVVRRSLHDWGVPERAIFLSSYERSGATHGNTLSDEIIGRLEEANLFIFIYTFYEKDWSRCMWEYGIVTGQATVPTRIVAFQATSDKPPMFEGKVVVPLDESGIKQFTEQFHRETGFITYLDDSNNPVDDCALLPDAAQQTIDNRAERFLVELREAIPSRRFPDRHLWDFLRLRLDPQPAEEIDELAQKLGTLENDAANDRLKDQIIKKLEEDMTVEKPRVRGPQGSDAAIRQFGFMNYQNGLKLKDLISRWRRNDDTKNDGWCDELYHSIIRALTNSQSAVVAGQLKSVREDTNWWYFPTLTRIRGTSDNALEFDLYLVRVPPPETIKSAIAEEKT